MPSMDPKQSLLDQLRIERPEHVRERKAPSRTRWMIAATILVIAVAGGIWLFASARGGIAVRAVVARSIGGGTSSAASGALLQASGYVVALREATVSAKAIYKVNTVLVQEGQAVKRGEVIARLDDSNVNAALEQSKTQLRQSEATLAAAKLAAADALPSYRRDQRQLAASLISSATFDASKARYDAAVSAVAIDEQNVVAARAAVGVNQSFENDTIIKA
ncbi:MAG TPA: biotin/lipoyl-binding protein, partial [Candidatus Binataceae bacterium]|nr:biotin/lipoyl-binding protein [Candidatus Binataceae bacterium]